MQTRLHLSPADHGRRLTYDEFAEASAEQGYRYELIGGRLEVSPAPNRPHADLTTWLEHALFLYSFRRPDVLARVSGHSRVVLPLEEEGVTAPEPDVAAYSAYPAVGAYPEGGWRDVSPVLVAEVLSPDTQKKDLDRNPRLYLQVRSIREYWVVDGVDDPGRPALLVHRRRGARWAPLRSVAAGETYTTPLLPGFSLVVDPNQRPTLPRE